MSERLKFTRAQIRNAAIIAKEEGVSIRLLSDGSLYVLPTANEILNPQQDNKNIIRL